MPLERADVVVDCPAARLNRCALVLTKLIAVSSASCITFVTELSVFTVARAGFNALPTWCVYALSASALSAFQSAACTLSPGDFAGAAVARL